MYQLRQYLCEKESLSTRRSFATVEEALEFRDRQRKANRSLRGFEFVKDEE